VESASELAAATGWLEVLAADEKEGSWFGRHKVLTGVGGGLAALLLIGLVASAGNDPTPVTGGPSKLDGFTYCHRADARETGQQKHPLRLSG